MSIPENAMVSDVLNNDGFIFQPISVSYKVRSFGKARKIFEWIEIEYNRKRAHTALGNISSMEFQEDKVAKAA